MSYTIKRIIGNTALEDVEARTVEALKAEGFGVLTRLDIASTLKQKIDVEFRHYVILGACNPSLAHKALQAEDHIGAMLPCNVVLQQKGDDVEIAAVDPVASMQAVENEDLDSVAREVRERLSRVVKAA